MSEINIRPGEPEAQPVIRRLRNLGNLIRATLVLAGCPLLLGTSGVQGVVWLLALVPLGSFLLYIGAIWRRYAELLKVELYSLVLSASVIIVLLLLV